MKKNLILLFACFFITSSLQASEKDVEEKKQTTYVLKTSDYKDYIEEFNRNDDELYQQYVSNDSAWNFLVNNIPFLDCPDQDVMTTYYFRWWTFRKHIKQTPTGFIFTEFLPSVEWSEKYNSIACAAAHHIYEGRWLKDSRFIDSYVKFWFEEGNPRMYSFWSANALWEYHKARGSELPFQLLPALVENYKLWEKGWERYGHFIGRNSDGLFSTYDDRDGMEMQIGGSGKRPTINSYMYADAFAISQMAKHEGKNQLADEYQGKAEELRRLVEDKLWDNSAQFFKTISEKDNQFVDVRELQGYTPWYVNLPTKGKGYEQAWQYILRTDAFDAPYGLTTAEQSHPEFKIVYQGHECQWNGPVWPFATSVTLTALANVLNNYSQDVVSVSDYYQQFMKYTRSHRMVCEDGRILPWIDENQNPYTGDWISRTRLKTWENGTWSAGKGGRERGKDYNHSTYCDLLITGLIGIRPQADHSIVVNPLIPQKAWDWFCLDGLEYQGHTLTVLYDCTGTRYHRGKGFFILVDGELKSHCDDLQEVRIVL